MYVKSLVLENLKAFSRLEFDFERPDGGYAGWTVLVGGNGSGKSTLLKTIALGLMGPEVGRQCLGHTAGWIRQGGRRATAELQIAWDAEADIFRNGGKVPVNPFPAGVRWLFETEQSEVAVFRTLEKRVGNVRIKTAERGPWAANPQGWFSAGYGPWRRLSGGSSESMSYMARGGVFGRHATLFREDAALNESEEWLRVQHSRWLEGNRPELQTLLEGAKALLGDDLLPHGMQVDKITVDQVFVRDRSGIQLPMRDISDGCRSVYATILDIVHGLFEVYGTEQLITRDPQGRWVVNHPGVVIIDEIEAHLHPAWQQKIPDWLKTHFPRIQFLVGTHSPLIAQAADPNGIFVLPLQDDLERQPRRLTPEEYEKIRLRKAEKTLLGIAFGLKDSRAPWANRRIAEWQRMNAKKQAGGEFSEQEERQYQELKRQMNIAFEFDAERAPA